ncbi:hypothetical protein DFH09DRAFT_1278103 [Mycena vulgaris]|nr:hypothetical protein DFH09DRAFT_1278103 [Mycena vulgaris]
MIPQELVEDTKSLRECAIASSRFGEPRQRVIFSSLKLNPTATVSTYRGIPHNHHLAPLRPIHHVSGGSKPRRPTGETNQRSANGTIWLRAVPSAVHFIQQQQLTEVQVKIRGLGPASGKLISAMTSTIETIHLECGMLRDPSIPPLPPLAARRFVDLVEGSFTFHVSNEEEPWLRSSLSFLLALSPPTLEEIIITSLRNPRVFRPPPFQAETMTALDGLVSVSTESPRIRWCQTRRDPVTDRFHRARGAGDAADAREGEAYRSTLLGWLETGHPVGGRTLRTEVKQPSRVRCSMVVAEAETESRKYDRVLPRVVVKSLVEMKMERDLCGALGLQIWRRAVVDTSFRARAESH